MDEGSDPEKERETTLEVEEGCDPEKEKETTDKMEEGSDPEEEEATQKMEGGSDPEEDETTQKMEEGCDPEEEEEKTTQKMEEGSDPEKEKETTEKMEEGSDLEKEKETAEKIEEESKPEKEETTDKMEEGSDPEKKMEAESDPKPEEKEKWVLKVIPRETGSRLPLLKWKLTGKRARRDRSNEKGKMISRKEKMTEEKEETVSKEEKEKMRLEKMRVEKGKMIVVDEREPELGESLGLIQLPSRVHNFCKFENIQRGSSSKHQPKSREVIEELAGLIVSSLIDSKVLEPECIEGTEVADLAADQHSKLPSLEVAFYESKAEMAEDGPRRWRPSENGWLKMNVEALISDDKMATGAVIRNSDGGFLAAVSETWDPETYIDTARLIALRNALVWAETGDRFRQEKIVVEINSDQLVQHLREFDAVFSELPDDLRDIVEECVTLGTHFQEMRFDNVSAEENRVAHCVASRALHQECEGDWNAFDAPEWLQEAVMDDLPF